MSIRLDLTGKRFGRLLAIECDGVSASGTATWKCLCNKKWGGCGKYKIARTPDLRSGNSKSCGCLRTEVIQLDRLVEDLTGREFGRWRVLQRAPQAERRGARSRRVYWECICDSTLGGCGKVKCVLGMSLKSGDSKSCGCQKARNVNRCVIEGLSLTAKQIAEICNLSVQSISKRIESGMEGNALLAPAWQRAKSK